MPPSGSHRKSRSLVFGLGASITNADGIITGAKLPSGRQILRCILYHCDMQMHEKRPGMTGAKSRLPGAGEALLRQSQYPNDEWQCCVQQDGGICWQQQEAAAHSTGQALQ